MFTRKKERFNKAGGGEKEETMAWIYAVRKGHKPGIYYDVEAYQKAIDGFPGAEGRRFQDEAAAKRYMDGEDPVKKGIYAVRRGRVPGIYFTAAECEEQVRGYNGAESQRFSNLEEAKRYMSSRDDNGGKVPSRGASFGRGGARNREPYGDRRDGSRHREFRRRRFVRAPHSIRGQFENHPGAASQLREGGARAGERVAQPIMVYTDGGCLVHEDGAGGYAAVICLPNGNRKEISGGVDMTRSDRMELLAAAAALRTLDTYADKGDRVQVYTDSQYLYQGVTKKIWTEWNDTEAKKPLNYDLWTDLRELTEEYDITWFWVKGHSGNPMNERCDWLATEAAKRTVAEKQWVPDFAAQLEAAKNRIKELERENKKLASDADRFRLLAEDRLSVSDRDLFQAVYNESVSGFLRWKMKRWMAKRK